MYKFQGTVKEIMKTQTWDSGFKKSEKRGVQAPFFMIVYTYQMREYYGKNE